MIPSDYEQFEQVVSVGVVNFTPVWGDPKQTLAKIEANVVEAAAQGIDIVAFGEEALIGPTGCDACRAEAAACEFHLELAQTVPGPATDHVADLAREHDLYVIFGLSERDADDPKVLYNAVAVIGPEGILGTYRKIHLGALPWVTEGIVFRPGHHAAGVPDAVRPDRRADLLRLLVQPRAHTHPRAEGRASRRQLLRARSQGEGKRDYMVHTTCTRAQENLIYTASANLARRTRSTRTTPRSISTTQRAADYLGHSTIAGPAFPRFSHVYAEAGDTEEIVSATLSFEKLHRWQSIFPMRDWRAGRQLDASRLIADEFTKLANP